MSAVCRCPGTSFSDGSDGLRTVNDTLSALVRVSPHFDQPACCIDCQSKTADCHIAAQAVHDVKPRKLVLGQLQFQLATPIMQKRAFTLNGRRELDEIIIVHKERSAQVRTSLAARCLEASCQV